MKFIIGTEKKYYDEMKDALKASVKEDDIDFVELNYKIDLLWEKAWDEGIDKEHFQEILNKALPEYVHHIRVYNTPKVAA